MQFVVPRRAWWLVLAVLAVAGGVMLAYAYWPQAVIKISAREMQRVVTQEITLSTHTTEPDFSQFFLPPPPL